MARGQRAMRGIGVAVLALAPLPLALPVAVAVPAVVPAADTTELVAADPYVPPPVKQLQPDEIRIQRGPEPRQLQFVTTSGAPLALVVVATSGDGRVKVASPGTDFGAPSTWRRLGFGDICWKARLDNAESYVLPASSLPFTGPPGNWRYSNVIVGTAGVPVVYNKPEPGEYVTGQGSPIESVISCVSAGGTRSMRSDPSVTTLPLATPTSDLPSLATPDTGLQPVAPSSASPSPSGNASTSVADSADPFSADKVTICHATTSVDNPYTLITVSVNSIENSGHLSHTGPLYPQQGWGDVIPPVDGVTDGVNWPAGEALLRNGCQVVENPGNPTLPPIEPPEPPVKPEPPIIVVPPIRPPSPSATPTTSLPEVTLTPNPSATPTAPVATLTPNPSGTPTAPVTPAPSSSGSATSTPAATPESTPGSTPDATPEPTSGPVDPGTITGALRDFCTTGDKDALAGIPRLADQKVQVLLTNGVSSIDITRSFVSLYCLALAGNTPDEDLVSTGMDTHALLTASLLLVGLGLLLVPVAARRR